MKIYSLVPCGSLKSCASFIGGCILFIGIAFVASNIVKTYLAADVMRDFMSGYFDISTDDVDEILEVLVKYRDNTKKIMALEHPDHFVKDLRKTTNEISFEKIEKFKEIQKLIEKQQKQIEEISKILDRQHDDIGTSIRLIEKASKHFNEVYNKDFLK